MILLSNPLRSMTRSSLLTALIAFCYAAPPGRAQFVINEFMANNLTSASVDEDSQREDWIEIQNNGSTPASLNGWYLTDSAGQLRKWQFPVSTPAISLAAGARITVWASDKNRKASAARLHANFKLSNDGEFLALVRPDGMTVEDSYAPKYPPQFPNGTYGRVTVLNTQVLVSQTGPAKGRSPLSADDFATNYAQWNTAPGFNDSSWQSGTGGFGFGAPFTTEIGAGGDLTAAMKGITPLALIRYTFNYTPGDPVAALRLRTKYDDGHISYLNGTVIAAAGHPSVLAWNSAAVSDRPDVFATTASTVLVANGSGPLVAGPNVLAVAVLNSAATELTGTPATDTTNLLLNSQLEMDTIAGHQIGYLSTATRGSANSAIRTSIGPAIRGTTDSPPQPTGGAASAPLLITTTVVPTLRPLADTTPVVLRWRRMYAVESTLPMLDDGTAGDVLAGDGVYSALVPTAPLLAGEMIRWRVQAIDNASPPNYSHDPPYPDFPRNSQSTTLPVPSATTEAEQYFGTMAVPVLTGSPGVPVLYWFLNGTDNSVNATGSRGSFFWQPLPMDNPPAGYVPPKPRFYDNVLADLHGQTSSGFPKKSHDLSFSKDNRFLWKDGAPDSSGVNLLTNYADKSKVRNAAAWWVWEKSGHLSSHYSTVVRVQQNNTFKGLYDLVENGNSAYLDRTGLDPNGTLYKMYNRLDSTSGAEKKNPDDTNTADITALINGLDPAQTRTLRLRYLYDNLNVPGLINFLAVQSILLGRDFGHKNFYMYRDTNGTLEWSILPWDQDLCMGHTYNAGQGYFDDDIHSQGPLQIGVTNRLLEMVYSTPELNHPFVRRLRTLAGQFFVSPTEMNGPIARFVNDLIQRIDPTPNNTSAGLDDADLEARTWGFWVDGSSAQIPWTDSRMAAHTARAQALRITTANPNPPNPGATAYIDGTTTLLPFLPGRRDFFFRTPAPTSPGMAGTTAVPLADQALPSSQPAAPALLIEQITPAPRTGVYQNQEFFVLRNPNNFAVDLSGWTIGGDIEMTFQGGTVIPAAGLTTTQTTNAAYVNELVVANQPAGIRTRTTAPMANQFRLVTGPYNRQLNGRGGVITLNRPNDPLNPLAGYTLVQSVPYSAAPTPHQEALRITELNYRPAPPTALELSGLPGLVAGDFEFIELMNTGTVALDLAKAFFDEGVEFTFPTPFSLNPGERCVVVASQTSFSLRYGSSIRVAGEFTGALNNTGERLRLMDSFGEMVLDFSWQDSWLPLPPGQTRTLTIRQPLPVWSAFGEPANWQLSVSPLGTPGSSEEGASVTYESWRYQVFPSSRPPADTAPGADPDGDGWNNFREYAFGSDPLSAASIGQVSSGVVQDGASRYQTITFVRPKLAIGAIWKAECAVDPAQATWLPQAIPWGNPVPLPGGLEEITWRDTVPLGSQTRRFLRAAARQ